VKYLEVGQGISIIALVIYSTHLFSLFKPVLFFPTDELFMTTIIQPWFNAISILGQKN